MSAVEVVSVSVSALALVLALGLFLSARANRRRTVELEATVGELTDQVRSSQPQTPSPPAEKPTVHVLEPYRPADESGGSVVVPTTAQVVDATLGRPLVRAATLTHGLRRALRPESRDRISGLVRREFRRRRRLRMRAGRRAARLAVVQPVDLQAAEQERAS
jgi:hypothetical protein